MSASQRSADADYVTATYRGEMVDAGGKEKVFRCDLSGKCSLPCRREGGSAVGRSSHVCKRDGRVLCWSWGPLAGGAGPTIMR